MKMSERIYLIGMMGCGKSYWGKRLAEKSGRQFIDLDRLIEIESGTSIAHKFKNDSEGNFREWECRTLKKTVQFSQAIIATGGGTPCFYDNLEWMKKNGAVMYLRTPVSLLAERLKDELHLRPLLTGITVHNLEAHLENLLKTRERYYLQADVVIEQPWPEQPEEVEKQLLEWM